MSKKPFAQIKNQPPAQPSEFQIKVAERQFRILQQQVANLSVQASQICAERDVLIERVTELEKALAEKAGA